MLLEPSEVGVLPLQYRTQFSHDSASHHTQQQQQRQNYAPQPPSYPGRDTQPPGYPTRDIQPPSYQPRDSHLYSSRDSQPSYPSRDNQPPSYPGRDSQAGYPAGSPGSGYTSKEAKTIQQPSPYIEQWSTEEVFTFNTNENYY